MVQCVAVPANDASINARIILQSTHHCHSFTLPAVLSVCTCVKHTTPQPPTQNNNNSHLLDSRSLYHRHVLYSFLSPVQQACAAHPTTTRHAGGSAPASHCDERRPPDQHHRPTTAGRASCEQNLCRHSTTTANCLRLSTNLHTPSFLVSHHPYILHCERGWLAAPPRP